MTRNQVSNRIGRDCSCHGTNRIASPDPFRDIRVRDHTSEWYREQRAPYLGLKIRALHEQMERANAGCRRAVEESRDQCFGSPTIGLELCARPVVLQRTQFARVIVSVRPVRAAGIFFDCTTEREVTDATFGGCDQTIPKWGRVNAMADLESLSAALVFAGCHGFDALEVECIHGSESYGGHQPLPPDSCCLRAPGASVSGSRFGGAGT